MDRCNILLTFPIYRGPQSSLQFTVNLQSSILQSVFILSDLSIRGGGGEEEGAGSESLHDVGLYIISFCF